MQVHRLPFPALTGATTTPAPAVEIAPAADRTPVERIFDHWVYMLGKNSARTALGPARRRVIERALALYDEDTLLLAVEGCAASAWHAGQNDRGRPFNDIELILRDEQHVERFAADGEALRERAEREVQRQATEQRAAERVVEIDPAAGRAARDSLQRIRWQIAQRMRTTR